MNLSKDNKTETKQVPKKEKNNKTTISFTPLEEDVALHKKAVREIKQAIWKKYNY